jgi:hypothetical protein
MIPKVIWTFWDTEELPEFIQKCIETWKFHNSDYEINVLSMDNYKKYISVDITQFKHYSMSRPQLTSDYIRICILKEHGGVWMDASIICIKPIKFKADTEFFAYYKDNYGFDGKYKYPMIDSWFLATTKNNTFINELCVEFTANMDNYYSTGSYVLLSGVYLDPWFVNDYYAVYFALLKTFKKLDNENKLPKMVLKHASKEGPLLDDIQRSLIGKLLCDTDFDKLRTPILKINRYGRETITKNKEIYDCIIKKIEHFGSDEYIEDMGYSDLDGYFQKPKNHLICINKLYVIIISVIAIILLLAMVVIIVKMKKNK